ncbi:MAG: protease complex subunit PrcB family protein [Burkholderiales bacterium]
MAFTSWCTRVSAQRGGYAVNITAITSEGGETRVTVRETVPAQGEMVTQALTYPFDIVKLEKDIRGSVKLEFIK